MEFRPDRPVESSQESSAWRPPGDWFLRQLGDVDFRLLAGVGWPPEGLVQGHGVGEKPAVAQEEAAASEAAGVVEAVAATGGAIAGEAGLGDFMPLAIDVADPLVGIIDPAATVAVGVLEVFKERVESSEMFGGSRPLETGDELPAILAGLAEPGGVDRVALAVGFDRIEEAVGDAGAPGVDQHALAAGAFAAEFAAADAGAPG